MVTRLPGEAIASMAPSSVNGEQEPSGADQAISTEALLEQLQRDRLWLLQQLDQGRWPDLRLDLAALERELGQLLEQAHQKLGS
ncbi:MAG: hypothetical protein RLZZ32_1273 [Cyanobacteriota bacterium]|jgi:hypothetical protein